jgi:methylated-DNA-[protein]-cysteine S-methyltransferase
VRAAIDGIVALLDGEPIDLSSAVLDVTGVPEFHRAVYAMRAPIRPGSTLSYGAIATRLGDPTAARAVGQALGQNPFAPIVPCHRVLAAGGAIGGFSAGGGATDEAPHARDRTRRASAMRPDLFDAMRRRFARIAAADPGVRRKAAVSRPDDTHRLFR